MNPAIRRGRWKSEEDEALKNAVNMYALLLKKDPWTEEEDKELKRTDNQCWRRYKVLIKQDDEGESTTNTPSENESEKNLKGQHSS
ncbi:unnamed protein product [Rhizophagus irregularis]|nr:unnamed protein product [Rhizophagus irregularis]